VVLVLVAVVQWLTGGVPVLLAFGPAVVVIVTIGQRLLARRRGRLVTGFVADPLGVENRAFLAQLVLRAGLAGLVVAATMLSIQRALVSDAEYRVAFVVWTVVPAALFVLLQLVPSRPVSLALNAVAFVAVAFLGFQLVQVHLRSGLGDDAVTIAPPFEDGEWQVLAGGRSTLVSHHYMPMTPQQRYAIDFLVTRDGGTYEGDADDPASYHAWDEPLIAPADGVIVDVENDLRDWPIGGRETDDERARGNYVVIDIGGGRYVTLAHLRQGSATVAEGDRVLAGQVVGRVGNSGNTDQPHLHLQVQDSPEFPAEPFATSVETFPIRLTDITHIRGGTEHPGQQGLLRRNDIVRVGGGS
jgi:hypothetical protein